MVVDDCLVMHYETHVVSLLQINAVGLFYPEVETCPKEWYPLADVQAHEQSGIL